ncbi:ABC-type Mn2+/Zn2+ transport systems, permease component [Archaeoglobus sulfaticallidus PM70-1]|uniref:ABC-type Mn2+/Zn2+ transport systems, permease component n=1 Tax=Archaeoglobus sulfaticallidus PM70-1 TaxID=387631 RepID=N0BGH6_9EURY|nr:iron chelate uptake ABC transporter family permease subunit [Archaeoglobus sulfaticallidus]AGK62103.1 ABC-type Mn2+/Zn2+ transport systems, permease component [Archaeoglobus sulfaticallidus PM70-1]
MGDLLLEPFVVRALIAILIIAINASIAGSFTVFRNVSFLIAGASHSALAGYALLILLSGYGIHLNPYFGSIAFALAIAYLAGRSKETNTAIGIAFAMSMSLAILFISMTKEYASKVWTILVGDLFLLTNQDIYLMILMTILIVIASAIYYRAFLFISFDPEGAEAFGINVKLYNYILLSMISLSTIILLKGVGAILVFAMLVAPSASANLIARNIREVFVCSFLIALTSMLFSLIISFFIELSPSALASLIASTAYFIASFRKE